MSESPVTEASKTEGCASQPPRHPRTVTVKHLVVLYALARRRWDIAIIVALGNGPSRFVELRDAAAMWMRRPCYNAELSRILPILIANGYVTGPHDKSEATYALTDRGRARLATFNALGGALDDEPRCRVTDL